MCIVVAENVIRFAEFNKSRSVHASTFYSLCAIKFLHVQCTEDQTFSASACVRSGTLYVYSLQRQENKHAAVSI